MSGNERRTKIIGILKESSKPVSGKHLADTLGVSRQVIVQDIALLRAEKHEIYSTNTGYILKQEQKVTRVFKVFHTDERTEEEMRLIVDYGGTIEDVFVYHKTYGVIKGELKIRSRADIMEYMNRIANGKSTFLKNVTSGYHYHTVNAPSEAILNIIQDQLQQKGFLAQLQEFEPVDFWKESQ